MIPNSNLSDAISSGSLVLAVLAALYTLWLGDVTAALGIVPKPDKDDRRPQKSQVTRALLTKALPLCLATVASFLILLPRAGAIVGEALRHEPVWQYDDVKAIFVLTVALLLVLAVVAIIQVVGLASKRRELG